MKFDIVPTTNDNIRSVTNGCTRFIDSDRFWWKSLDLVAETLVDKKIKRSEVWKKNFWWW